MESSNAEVSATPVPLTYATPAARRNTLFRLLVICIVGLLAVFAACEFKPRYTRSREAANRIQCAMNMRQIGLAMMTYANAHGGKFPDSLHEILETEDITPEVFVCPSTNDVRAIGPTTRAVLDGFDHPGHCSCIYLGKGLTDQCGPQTVVLYEPMSNHHDGLNVLFGDGHVEFFSGAKAQSILNAIAVHQPVIVK